MKNTTSFNENCYQILKKVPRSKVTTYGEIARTLHTKAYRSVGNAMNKSPGMPKVPCHRVVCTDGKIGGFAFGVNKKIRMLKKEGIKIINGKVNLGKFLYKFK